MSSQLRVLHVLHDLSGGGAERLVLDLCRKSAQDIEPLVAVLRSGGELTSLFSDAGIPVKWAGGRKGHLGVRALGNLVRWSRQAHVIHTHLWSGDFYGGLAARLAGRPVVSSVHNTRGDGRLRDWLVGRFATPEVWVGVSAAAGQFAVKRGADETRVQVILNGVDLTRFRPTPWNLGPPWNLLVVGRLTEQKGIDQLIHSLVGLDEVALHLVGTGEEMARLKSLSETLGVQAHFHGWMADVSAMYVRCHALLMPSRWEGFGLVAVEAMASGRPVISTAVDGLEQVLGGVGFRFDGTSVEDIRQTIVGLLAQPNELEKRARLGPRQAAQFSIESTVHAYESLYRQLAFNE